jgi:glycosyltransferase involved in cell wall biosynthesis
MRVLMLIDSLAVGGAEQSLAAATPALIRRGVELHIGALEPGGALAANLQTAGGHVVEGLGERSRLATIAALRRHIRAVAPDIVHTTLFEADIAGRCANVGTGRPTVSSLVTEAYGPEHLDNPDFRRSKVRLAQLADATTARFVDRFHAVSESTRQVMARRLRIDPNRITVIPRGRDSLTLGRRSPNRTASVRARLQVSDEEVLLLAAGRHYHYKGLDRIVAAMPAIVEAIPSARLFIAGRDGPSTVALRRLADEHRLASRVELLGHRTDLADLMCAADVFVLPSRAEGSPGVLLESMALETPVVAADIPSVREVASHGEVVLVDEEAWDGAIAGVVEDPVATSRRVEAARRRFEQLYTSDAVADATVAFYESVL